MAKKKLVVVGNGMAGVRAVEEVLLRGGADLFDIVIFGAEPYGNYNRIMLSSVLSGEQDASEIFMNPLDWYRERNIALHAGDPVARIDRAAKIVVSEAGLREGYDKLLIATGSRPFIPPIDGVRGVDGGLKSGVFGFRSMDDCNAIMARAGESSRAAVIGGGLLGLEAAHGLLKHMSEVHVVHSGRHLMNQQLDAAAGAMLAAGMAELGARVHLDKRTVGVVGESEVAGVAFKDGERLDCELVVLAAGVRPNIEIGLCAGLTVERAIVVDDHMRTEDDPDVYALGECAQHRGKVYGMVAPLWEQGKVFADHVTQTNPDARYHGSKLATKLKVMGIELASMGSPEPQEGDELIQFSEPRRAVYKKLVIRNGRLVGGVLLGDIAKAAYLMQAFAKDAPLPEDRLRMLFDFGAPSGTAAIEEMSAETQVCNCSGVTKAAIASCVAAGHRTLKAAMDATRAGKGCGACKPLVAETVLYFCGGEAEEDPSIHYYVPCIPMTKPRLAAELRERGLKSVSAVFDALAGGVEDAASKPALASLLATIWNRDYEDERGARFINDRVHANIQKDGSFSVVPEMPGGVCTPAELMRIAEVALKYHIPLVKLTGGQRIDLVGAQKNVLPAIWRDLDMPAGAAWAKAYRTCKSCIGSDYCRFGLDDSMGLAQKVERRFRGVESPAKLKLATAGCPRNCSEAMIKDVGFVAIGDGNWEIYVGGAGGSHVRKGDLLCTVDGEEKALALAGRFLQYYRENANWRERTYDFIERVGIDHVRAVVAADSEGQGAALDAAMQAAVDAACDPWKEASAPRTANQFAAAIGAED
ncbi:nitrite reductase large subunit NirB [Methylocystis heyeri]|uniref:NAD(P)/FAD-dependent oxidoreductase n=1 Tax=Methylocystis heyeri TaxID=391905 RepID=A0A6B8KC71_9HYPH|nr:nitrite reductase large subunit NirB [Methylocystis heyeri]QGM44671.1 NAD(P)/FAD-dependent oxidoreductase [Methylocystis heyeri]